MITFLFSIDVKKQSSMGLFFFYPNLSEFLCKRFRKGAQPNGMDKRDILSVGMCCLSQSCEAITSYVRIACWVVKENDKRQ